MRRVGLEGGVESSLEAAAAGERALLEQLGGWPSGAVGFLGINRSALARSQALQLANAMAGCDNDSIRKVIESM